MTLPTGRDYGNAHDLLTPVKRGALGFEIYFDGRPAGNSVANPIGDIIDVSAGFRAPRSRREKTGLALVDQRRSRSKKAPKRAERALRYASHTRSFII